MGGGAGGFKNGVILAGILFKARKITKLSLQFVPVILDFFHFNRFIVKKIVNY